MYFFCFQDELNATIQHIICIEVNKACYNLIGQCTEKQTRDQINLKDIEIVEERFTNETLSDFKLKISSGKTIFFQNIKSHFVIKKFKL